MLMSMDFTLNGLPLHPLLVHAVIALFPLTAAAVVLHVLWPAARRRLGIITPLLGAAAAVVTPVTVLAGMALLKKVGPIPAAEYHASLGILMPYWAGGLLVVSVLAYGWFSWRDRLRISISARAIVTAVVAVLGVGVSIGALVMCVVVGEAGSRAVWGR